MQPQPAGNGDLAPAGPPGTQQHATRIVFSWTLSGSESAGTHASDRRRHKRPSCGLPWRSFRQNDRCYGCAVGFNSYYSRCGNSLRSSVCRRVLSLQATTIQDQETWISALKRQWRLLLLKKTVIASSNESGGFPSNIVAMLSFAEF